MGELLVGIAITYFVLTRYIDTHFKEVHAKLDTIVEQFDGLREYLYEIDPQFDEERELRAELFQSLADGSFSMAGMDLNELERNKKEQGRRTLNTPLNAPAVVDDMETESP